MALSLDEALGVATLDEGDKSIHIDLVTRQVVIPESEKLFGVESDDAVEVKHIVIDGRYTDAGKDISELSWRVNFRNANGDKNVFPVTKVTAGDDSVEFDWIIRRSVVAYKGSIDFVVCAFGKDSDGKLTPEWNSTLGHGDVLEGLEVDAEDIGGDEILDELKSLQVDMKALSDSAAKSASDALDSKNAAAQIKTEVGTLGDEKKKAITDESIKQQEAIKKKGSDTLTSIPEDYQQLTTDVSQLKEDTTALQKRQNVLVGSETGNPASCNDAFAAPLCGLTVYGKSTQDGTPTPDAPVPIVSAGDDGSITMKVTGKNLYHAAWTGNYSKSGLLLTATSTTIAIKGTATEDAYITQWLVLRNDPIPLDPNKRYTFTPKLTENVFEGLMVYTYDEKGVGTYTGSNIPARSTGVSVYYQKKFKKDETIDFKTSIQLEIGTEATVYEPYREQLLTLSTPNGLPGIPVTSGGNYTDQNGQQWVCDEVDLERGVKVQKVTTIVFSDQKKFTLRTTSTSTKFRFSAPVDGLKTANLTTADSSAFCSALALGKQDSTWTIPNTFTIDADGKLYVRFENINSLDELQQYLQRTPMSLTAILATPIETPLTPAEIAAYKALTAYAPDTVVQASDGAGIKLDYQRDVNLVVKNLEDAIASMTTTT